MTRTDADRIIFDRRDGSLTTPDFRSRALVRMLQTSHKVLAPVGHLGISRVHAAINKLMRDGLTTTVRDGAGEFSYPSNDYYWNRLLDPSYAYEPEIDAFLRCFAKVPFVFVDLGANFGYWTQRVIAGEYGEHSVVAVEASDSSFAILKNNTGTSGGKCMLYHRAIDNESGKELVLYGTRHAGCSIDQTWYGASTDAVNRVVTISIDDLLSASGVAVASTPTIVKLDVEGVELRALTGAPETIAGPSAFILEDADRDGPSPASRYAIEECGMSLFVLNGDTFEELRDLAALGRVKDKQSKVQATGLNIVATASEYWCSQLRNNA